MWEQAEHVVCRVKHPERLLAYQDRAGQWQDRDLAHARQHLRHLATAETMLVVQRGRQRRAKQQRKPGAQVAAAPGRRAEEVGPLDPARLVACIWRVGRTRTCGTCRMEASASVAGGAGQ